MAGNVRRAALPRATAATITALTTDQIADTENLGVTQPFQRKTFNALGRRWLFYADGTSSALVPGMYFTSSADGGATWRAPTLVRTLDTTGLAIGAAHFDTHFDGTYVHYAVGSAYTGGSGEFVYYRRGLLNADGSITWTAEQAAAQGVGSSVLEVSITVDTTGHPWITYEDFGPAYARIVTSTATNGTWATRSGYPLRLASAVDTVQWWTWVGALASGGIAAMYFTDQPGSTTNGRAIYLRVYDGSSWGSQEIIDYGADKGDGIATNIAAVTDPATGDVWIAYGDSFGNTLAVRRDSGAGLTQYYDGGVTGAMPGLAVGFDSNKLHLIGTDPVAGAVLLHRVLSGGTWNSGGTIVSASSLIHPGGLVISERADGGEFVVAVQYSDGNTREAIETFGVSTAGGPVSTTGTVALFLAATGAAVKAGTAVGAVATTLATSGADDKAAATVGAAAVALAASGADAKAGAVVGAAAVALAASGADAKTSAATGDVATVLTAAGADVKTGSSAGAVALAVDTTDGDSKTGVTVGTEPVALNVTVDAVKIADVLAAVALTLAVQGVDTTDDTKTTTGTVSLAMLVDAVAAKNAAAAGALAVALVSYGDVAKTAALIGSLGLQLNAAGIASAVGGGSKTTLGEVTLALAIVATAARVSPVAGALSALFGVSGAASKTVSTSGMVGLTLGASGVARVISSAAIPQRAYAGRIARAQAGTINGRAQGGAIVRAAGGRIR
jgi:hypothetical protein